MRGSLLPSNCPEILKPIEFKDGRLEVKPLPDKDTHVLTWTDKNGLEIVIADHPNGYSCHSLAERVVNGNYKKILEQAKYIVDCAGTVNSIELNNLISR